MLDQPEPKQPEPKQSELEQSEPDLHSSHPDYQTRFSGSVGKWLLDIQTQGVHACLSEFTKKNHTAQISILDIGGGHGQLTSIFLALGFKVTLLASCETAISESQRALLREQKISLLVTPLSRIGDLNQLYGQFDIVASLRILAHVHDYQQFIFNCTKFAKSGILVDYPVWQSFNLFSTALFSLKKGVEKNTRRYQIFSQSQLAGTFSELGFSSAVTFKQFFLPMALHRTVKSKQISQQFEAGFRLLGLTDLFGSPCISLFTK
jgi:2-polyprenyl-3-methyl-5-hydroxy-6-metoxy-1,4-benzoquinol methylase